MGGNILLYMKNLTKCYTPFVFTLIFLVSACSSGGSSDNDDDPTAPTPTNITIDVGLKKLQFNWDTVSNVDFYRVQENSDGSSGFSQVGSDIPNTQTSFDLDIAVHLQNWTNATYQIEACNSVGCTPSNIVSAANGAPEAIGYFKASNTDVSDFFGISALSGDGNTLAVSSVEERSAATGINGDQSDNSAEEAGAVYIFVRANDGNWNQQAYIKASNTDEDDRFGFVSLSHDGNTLAVGAADESSSATGINGDQADNSASESGAVYIFTRDNNGNWSQQAYIKASNTDAGDEFQIPVLSADGNTLAVGAEYESSAATGINGNQADNSALDAGAVYIFTRDNIGNWSQQAYLKASNTDAGDRFGIRLSISADGDTLAIGADGESSTATGINGNQADNSAPFSGAAYIFARDNLGSWSQQAYIKASNTEASDDFNEIALSSDGNTLAVGACAESSSTTSINGNQSDNSSTESGAVYVYTRDNSNNWSQQAYIKASNTDAEDNFCLPAINNNGNILVVGATLEDSASININENQADNSSAQSGAAYLFERDNNDVWSQRTYIKAPNSNAADFFGYPSISADGRTLAIGAFGESSTATGINENQDNNDAPNAGALYLY